ncbi:MAG: PhzF family phenazine biosynthesis protein, partial [Chloroflexota bacterium]
LCGHATLASAHILWESGRLAVGETARFYTQSGLLTARRDGDWIELDFPVTVCEPAGSPAGLVEALGVSARAVFRAGPDYVVELASEAEVRAAKPDLARLLDVNARGIAITAPASTPGYDIASRFFAPAVGIPEDPVTGSLHCALAPLWSARLGKSELTAYQASARGGALRLRLAAGRVLISGQAVTIFRADLL